MADERTTCEWCGAPITQPKGKGRRRRFCDPKTTGRWCQKDAKRAGGIRPTEVRCAFCDGPIPSSRRRGAMYCSTRCKNQARLVREKEARREKRGES